MKPELNEMRRQTQSTQTQWLLPAKALRRHSRPRRRDQDVTPAEKRDIDFMSARRILTRISSAGTARERDTWRETARGKRKKRKKKEGKGTRRL
jgi:hypothetical protein